MSLIEDCALALQSCLGGKPLGSFGDSATAAQSVAPLNVKSTVSVPGADTMLRSFVAAEHGRVTSSLAEFPPCVPITRENLS